MHQLRILWALAAFFFGEKSQLLKALVNVIVLIKLHCITFEAMQINDNQFFTKFGYQLDTRIFRWLQQWESADEREKNDDDLVNFRPLVNQILNAQFIQVLPSTFKQKENEHNNDDDSFQRPKKKKRQNQENSQMVRNSGRITEWTAASGDDYQKLFTGKYLDMRPMFKGLPMCQRYHSKGHCFSDCINAITHVPSTNIPSNTKAEYSQYCQKCKVNF